MIINIGDKIGNLTVINFSHKDKWKKSYYVCLCDCGNIVVSRDTSLKFHKTHSCGCIKYTKHGMNRTRLYGIWCNMKSRCRNKNTPAYLRYGERGIAICDEWIEDFRNFLSWALENGYNDSLSIDRIDCDGDYNPQNCRWADNSVQSNNRRCNHYITIGDDTLSLSEWCKKLGKVYGTVRSRINKLHWSPEEALEIVGRGDVV